ncbi:SagB/ThcOx family dehydrogenase [Achromobacter sp. GG226]|uniref:SagB/ThcOx family dehydrogenase n=1 Tax=Verticiella alkaliphila TaxID=2779529 RepID=UPI001C0BE0EA|nr:SagB/ThcOx family dehydrogenase [Verticiella sp. GG226]MBU4609253.1 SagB/ThcOx family dehydrogenase [Verticiella sp. GG226]
MTDLPPEDPAPAFRLFWDNSSLTPARALRLAEAISMDAMQAAPPPRPLYGTAAQRLPAPDSPLTALWRERHSERRFGATPLTAAGLGNLLSPLASRAAITPGERGRLLPSGGAKYPVLTYAAVLNVADAPALQGKLAWYDPEHHGLVPLGALPPWQALAASLGVDWAGPPALVLFFVVQAQGTLAKYGERGGRFVLIETGTALAAVTLEATRQGLAGVPVASFEDGALLALCGLAPATHGLALAAAFGPAPG